MTMSRAVALSALTVLVLAASPSATAEELIPTGAEWRYLKGTEAPPASWNTAGFDDGGWDAGPAGIGYGDSALLYLFSGAEARCALAMDIDANGEVNVTDPVRLLNHLFVDGPGPEAPYPDCGVAANREAIPCGEGCGGA